LVGIVRVDDPPSAGARAFSQDSLTSQLAASGLRPGPVVTLPPPAAALAARALQSDTAAASAAPALEVELPPGQSCVLLVEDENGALTWALPDGSAENLQARSLATSVRFTLEFAPRLADAGRGLLSDIGAKVQGFFFDATDALLGPIVHGFARKWEAKHRPTFVRRFDPANYRIDEPTFERFSASDWDAVATGPALLFVHGTFSTSGAFRGLTPETIGALSARYRGRIFAFNHPSLTADPRENALAFLSSVPQDTRLELDIVCHSRGGLVAREIESLGRAAGNVRVRRMVFVGATNAGTALADPEHVVDMIGRFTTIAKVLPEGTVKTAVDALVLAVKVLAHGLLTDLEGLAAMNPNGAFVKAINVPGPSDVEFFAMASDFEPKPGTPLISIRRAEDVTVDRIFERVANDLVVPRDGVFAKNGAGGFPIDTSHCLLYGVPDGVVHTEFFNEPRTGTQLLQWLAPEAAPQGRGLVGELSSESMARIFDSVRDRVLLELGAQGVTGGGRGVRSTDSDLTPAELDALRPHVINLSEGTFSSTGIFRSTREDVAFIVRERIPAWAAALPAGAPLRVVVWAHGGLIGEKAGLRIAQKHVEWWKKNGVYPLYFVWETGLFDALRAILEQVRRKIPGLGGRDLFDFTTDPLLALGAHALGGVKIWGAMKRNAELASADAGGAREMARQLSALAADTAQLHGHELELHAVGHSAGSIFHSWFLPMAHAEKVPAFKTLQLLAPAITVDEFDARLAPEIGDTGAVRQAVLFTMKRSYEEADNCAQVYRKSLLYLIHHALEPDVRTPILGLEISLRADSKAASLFGLGGTAGAPGRVVWSVSDETAGRSASAAVHHGDFDDDPATMSSVAANVLDTAQAAVRYPGTTGEGRGIGGDWPESDDWLRGVDVSPHVGVPAMHPAVSVPGRSAPPPAAAPGSLPPARPPAAAAAPGGGRRLALCIGIDAYKPPNTLAGCVNDTNAWKSTLEALGFKVDRLLDEKATRQSMIDALSSMVRSALPGDVLVLQYSGHGTQVPDVDGDEDDGDDEALVPYDFPGGAFLIDDDLRRIFTQLPAGVNLTCFIDCCHSGSITRMLGRNADDSTDDGVTRSRYLKRGDEWDDWMRAHERFRQRERAIRDMGDGRRALVDANSMRWVNFSACDATEVAYETRGSGDFTKLATALMLGAATQQSHREFQDAVIQAFGEHRRQTPQLDCADASKTARLLGQIH
jgi:hypothetical protein